MKCAPKIIFLVRDPDGLGLAFFDSLIPTPGSNLAKSATTIELSLANYGLADEKVTGDLINFVDQEGSPQVSILFLPNYEPPIAACAVREVLSSITSDLSDQPTIVLPLITKPLKFYQGVKNLPKPEQDVAIYASEIGATNELTRAVVAGTVTISSSLQLNYEPLACLLHMVRVLRVPTVVLVASDGQNQNKMSTDYELKALCKVGEFLAGHMGLGFSRDGLQHKPLEKSWPAEEPWRALYL